MEGKKDVQTDNTTVRIDIHNYAGKLNNLIRDIENNHRVLRKGNAKKPKAIPLKLSKANQNTLLRYKDAMISEGLSNPRVLKQLDQLLRIAVWLGKDFKQATEDDLRNMITSHIQTNPKYSQWTKAGYIICTKRFYKWLEGNGEEYPQKVRWMKPKCPPRKPLGSKEIFTEQEILDIINKGCISERDRAIIAIGYEGLMRIGELGSLRVGWVDIKDGTAQVLLSGKTGEGETWIKFAVPYVRRWLSLHPLRVKPNFKDQPLFVMLGKKNRFEPITYGAVRKAITAAVERAGIKKKCNPHLLFRKSRASFLSSKLTERELMNVGRWRNHDSVSHYVAQRDTKDIMQKIYGLEKEEPEESRLKPIKCKWCGYSNEPCTTECENCHNSTSEEVNVFKEIELLKRQNILLMKLIEKGITTKKKIENIEPEKAKALLEGISVE